MLGWDIKKIRKVHWENFIMYIMFPSRGPLIATATAGEARRTAPWRGPGAWTPAASTRPRCLQWARWRRRTWVGPWEKVSQNIDPSENHFFVTNYQHWTGTSALEPFLAPPAPWGGLGGPRGVLGGLPSPKFPLSLRDQFQARDALFWIETTCNTMFLSFRVKMGPSGPKKGRFGPK